jgi:ribonuclease P protein component
MGCPATARLHDKAQYEQGLDQRIVARSPHFVLHAPVVANVSQTHACTPLIGTVIPKRWAKRAVTRNAIRRQIHEAWAEWAPGVSAGICVVRLKQAYAGAEFPSATSPALQRAVRNELNQLFSQWLAA